MLSQPLPPAAAPLGREHDEIERVRDLDLQPCRAAAARFVAARRRLRHDAFVTERRAPRRGTPARRRDRSSTSRGTFSARRHDAREPFEALGERPVDEVLAVDVQAIERRTATTATCPSGLRRRACGRSGASCLGTAAAGRPRVSASTSPSRIAAPRRHRRDRARDLRHARRDVAPRSRVNAHAVVAFVDLHARAVELVLEHGRRRAPRARSSTSLRRAREHRRQRLVERQAKTLEPCAARLERGSRNGRDAAGEHDRAPHVGRRDTRQRPQSRPP